MKEKPSSLATLNVMGWNVGEVAGREDVEMSARSGREDDDAKMLIFFRDEYVSPNLMLRWTPHTPTRVTVVSDVLGRSIWNVGCGGKASVMGGGVFR